MSNSTIRLAVGAVGVVAGACALVAARRKWRARAPRLSVLVASTSKQKLGAAERALNAASVNGVNVESHVADQPLGWDETIRGAKNRMAGLLQQQSGADIAVSS